MRPIFFREHVASRAVYQFPDGVYAMAEWRYGSRPIMNGARVVYIEHEFYSVAQFASWIGPRCQIVQKRRTRIDVELDSLPRCVDVAALFGERKQ